jgi:DNA replication protein DnaC
MEAISKLIGKMPGMAAGSAGRDITAKEQELRTFKINGQLDYAQFEEMLKVYAQEIILDRSVVRPFVIDNNNLQVIKQLYLYITGNPACLWNLNSGLIFGGKVGCGKSVLMKAYIRISNELTKKQTTQIHSKTLASLIRHKTIDYYEKRPLFIDELGREESETKDFGNVIKPVIDLFSIRYEKGARTYATTNFNYNSLENFYGNFIRSRMEEMMTYIHLPGESRRLKNEINQ